MKFENQEEALNSIMVSVRANKKLPKNYRAIEKHFHKTFLFYCVEKNKSDFVKELMEAGDDFTLNGDAQEVRFRHRLNAFTAAIYLAKIECLSVFLAFGADLFSKEYGREEVWRRARHAETILFLHNNKQINLNKKDKNGATLLGRMITEAHQIKDVDEICKIINLNILDINLSSSLDLGGLNKSPLMIAISRGILPIVKTLVENGAKMDYIKEDGKRGNLLSFAFYRAKELKQTQKYQDVLEYLKAWDEKNKLERKIENRLNVKNLKAIKV